MDRAEIPFLSAVELGELLREREVSPVEATEAYLARIQEVEPKTNAYITVCGDEALAAARQAESEIAGGNYRGVLHGVPVAVKDQIHTRGIRTTIASRVRSEYIPDEDATVVTRLKEAGAVLLGKLNMAEMALGDPMNSAFRPSSQPVGPDPQPRHLQHRLRGSDGCFPLRHLFGRGYRRLHPTSRRQLRTGRPASFVGPGQPVRRRRGLMVGGYHRAHLALRGRLRRDHTRHRRT